MCEAWSKHWKIINTIKMKCFPGKPVHYWRAKCNAAQTVLSIMEKVDGSTSWYVLVQSLVTQRWLSGTSCFPVGCCLRCLVLWRWLTPSPLQNADTVCRDCAVNAPPSVQWTDSSAGSGVGGGGAPHGTVWSRDHYNGERVLVFMHILTQWGAF